MHDGGTNYLSGIAGMKEMRPQLETVFAPIQSLDPQLPFAIRDIAAFTPIGSDHESFTAAGVPGFFWDQAGRANYTHTHHTQYDTYDSAIPEYQRHSAVVAAVSPQFDLRRSREAEVRELATRERVLVLTPSGAARIAFPEVDGVRSWVLLPAVARPAEVEDLLARIRAADVLVLHDDASGPFAAWEPFAAEVARFTVVPAPRGATFRVARWSK